MVKANYNKVVVGLIILFSFAFYGKTLNHQFVWDDERSHLTKHADVMEGKLGAIWSKPYDGMYIPVTYTIWTGIKSLAYNKQKKELNPKLFHFANIAVHAFNTILIFFILLLLIKNTNAAIIGSCLFLVHPLQVESVAWVSEFRGLLATFFSFLSMYVVLKNVTSVSTFKSIIKSKWFILASVFFVIALLSKPSAIVLPFVLVLVVWTFFKSHWKILAKALFIWVLFILPIVLLTSKSQSNELLSFIVPVWQRPFVAAYSFVFYLYKLILPIQLSGCYGLTPEVIASSWWMYLAFAALVGLFVFLFVKRDVYKISFASFLIIVIAVLPVLGIISFYYQRYSNVADRYMYFGMFAVSIFVAYLWHVSSKKNNVKTVLIVFVIACSILSYKQLSAWENEFAVWDNAMEQNPNQWNAAYNRAVQFGKQGKLKEAIADYSTALQLKPTDKISLVNRANAYGMLNDFEKAIADYSEALKQDEKDASIYYNRALTYYYMKNIKACSYDLQMAIKMGFKADPQFVKEVKAELKSQFGR